MESPEITSWLRGQMIWQARTAMSTSAKGQKNQVTRARWVGKLCGIDTVERYSALQKERNPDVLQHGWSLPHPDEELSGTQSSHTQVEWQ